VVNYHFIIFTFSFIVSSMEKDPNQ